MKKILASINKKTGVLTIRTEGFAGAECLEATKKIVEDLGMQGEPELTAEYFQVDEQQQQQNQST